MPKKRSDAFYHFVAFLTVAIWGTTYVATRWMIKEGGMDEVNIFVIRFIIAYLIMLALSHKHLWADNWRDELILAGVGLMGGSAYFISENAALGLAPANDVSIIVASSPLFTIIAIALLFKGEKFKLREYIGSVICLVGVSIIILNSSSDSASDNAKSGDMALIGNLLALVSCLTWVVYTLLVRLVSDKYPATFVTRKMFFYGVVTALPMYFFYPLPDMHTLMNPYNLLNLLFLGCIASSFCFFSWNWCLANLGSVKTSNWNYMIPLTTVIFAWLVLGESMTLGFIIGGASILIGMYMASKP